MSELTPHGRLIEEARGTLSVRKAAQAGGISEGRWRQIVKGVQKVGGGVEVPVTTKPQTLVAMARAVGADVSDVLEAAGMQIDLDDYAKQPVPADELEQRLRSIEFRLQQLESAANPGPVQQHPSPTPLTPAQVLALPPDDDLEDVEPDEPATPVYREVPLNEAARTDAEEKR